MPVTNSDKMNGGVPHYSTLRSISASRRIPFHLRFRRRVRQTCRICHIQLKHVVIWRDLPLLFLTSVLVALICNTLSLPVMVRRKFFDDTQDLLQFEQAGAEAVRNWKKEAALGLSDPSRLADPTRLFNMSEVKEARAQWDYIYREITRHTVPPVLTKYKARLLQELFKMTKYTQATKLTNSLHASCNYFNNIEDAADLTAFKCSETSHKCPDGSFKNTIVFTPLEGSWVTWNDVVIVLMVGAGREEFLEALSDTWIRRLGDDATIFISLDKGYLELPQALRQRKNVIVHDYEGPQGLDQLDIKAFTTWQYIFKTYEQSNKKYFLKIDDDAFLVGHNLLRFLMKIDRWFAVHEEPLYFGHPFCGHGDLEALGYAHWCYAGGGAYGLNTEALGMMVRQTLSGCAYFYDYVAKAPNMRPVPDSYGGRYEDVMVGRCLRQAKNRRQLNGTSLLACGSIFPYAPLHYYEKFGKDASVLGKKIGDSVITLHNLTPSAIRYVDFYLFELPIGGPISPFSSENPRLEELLRICHLNGKKMWCDWSPSPSTSADSQGSKLNT